MALASAGWLVPPHGLCEPWVLSLCLCPQQPFPCFPPGAFPCSPPSPVSPCSPSAYDCASLAPGSPLPGLTCVFSPQILGTYCVPARLRPRNTVGPGRMSPLPRGTSSVRGGGRGEVDTLLRADIANTAITRAACAILNVREAASRKEKKLKKLISGIYFVQHKTCQMLSFRPAVSILKLLRYFPFFGLYCLGNPVRVLHPQASYRGPRFKHRVATGGEGPPAKSARPLAPLLSLPPELAECRVLNPSPRPCGAP